MSLFDTARQLTSRCPPRDVVASLERVQLLAAADVRLLPLSSCRRCQAAAAVKPPLPSNTVPLLNTCLQRDPIIAAALRCHESEKSLPKYCVGGDSARAEGQRTVHTTPPD